MVEERADFVYLQVLVIPNTLDGRESLYIKLIKIQ